MVSNARYFARRAAQEEMKAAQALTSASAERHRQFAELFRERLQQATQQ
jgi:hypothetical protein